MITLKLSEENARRLVRALDSHIYWQLSEPEDRRDGYVVNKRGSEEIRACDRLMRRIEEALPVNMFEETEATK